MMEERPFKYQGVQIARWHGAPDVMKDRDSIMVCRLKYKISLMKCNSESLEKEVRLFKITTMLSVLALLVTFMFG